MKNISSIIFGVGRMGQRYLKILADLEIQVAAICDHNLQAVAAASQICPAARTFTDPAELFRELKAELVIIASTATSHCDLVLAAITNGAKYIVCEKPMAVSVEQAEKMLAAAEQAGVGLAINHQMRFMPQYTRVKELLDSEDYSGLCSMNVVAGNFGLTMNGSHYIEAFRFLSGQEPISVSAWLSGTGYPNPRGSQFEDQAGTLRITGNNGARFFLDCSANQGHGMRAVYATKHGLISVDEAFGQLSASCRNVCDRDLPTTRIVTDPVFINETLQAAEVLDSTKSVLSALLNGHNYCDARQALTIIKTLVAAYVSSEDNHREVFLSEELPKKRCFSWA